MSPTDRLRPITPADLDWVIEVTRRCCEALVVHAPRFWRPAYDAMAKHAAYFGQLIDDPAVFTVRSDHGYLVALSHGWICLVDDAVVTEPGDWLTDGVRLLRYAQQLCGPLRFVVPVCETRRMDAALHVGLSAAEHWWHRDLPDRARTGSPRDGERTLTDGAASGRLVIAPPIYSPGGPVLVVTAVESAAALPRGGRVGRLADSR